MSEAFAGGSQLSLPPLLVYPERSSSREGRLQRLATAAQAVLLSRATGMRAHRLASIVVAVATHAARMSACDDMALAHEAGAVAVLLKRDASWPEPILARSFALIREVATRVLGQRHHDVQLIGGYALLRGMIAEMGTGEGKTLTAALAAGTAGLAGLPVHVVTVNAYLAARDAALLGPLYAFLGLSTGLATEKVPTPQRAAAYQCDITYCTNKDLAFDYMRDRLVCGRRTGNLRRKAAALAEPAAAPANVLLRGLHFAIVDEADSVLIDEARTPLILSGDSDATRDEAVFDLALTLARDLKWGVDFEVFGNERRVGLLPRGRHALAPAERHGQPWNQPAERERLIGMALTAVHMLHRDEHYLVREGKVEIIDEYSGRTMADRTWSEGLHEMVERKERLELSPRRGTRARMTYQRFFRRYCRLAGMTGTACEVAAEFWRVYRLRVATIPAHRPSRRTLAPPRVHATAAGKWRSIADEVAEIHSSGAPVLIGTRTVAASASAADALNAAGLQYTVLSAAQDASEAQVIGAAGRRGAITVATNMAGRGTDIRLGADALEAGGLYVIMSERHEAGRIDRQLAGRCGRQGDPGTVIVHVSLEDALVQRHCPKPLIGLARARAQRGHKIWIAKVTDLAQRRAEGLHARMRRDLLRSDEWIGDAIAFVGEPE